MDDDATIVFTAAAAAGESSEEHQTFNWKNQAEIILKAATHEQMSALKSLNHDFDSGSSAGNPSGSFITFFAFLHPLRAMHSFSAVINLLTAAQRNVVDADSATTITSVRHS